MRKIDIHHHLLEETDYANHLLRTMDKYKIEKTCIIGLGPLARGMFAKGFPTGSPTGSGVDNVAVERTFKAHPERFIGMGFIRLGVDTAVAVDELVDRGFTACKFHIPKQRYSEQAYFPVYERACRHKLPCLFHTGIVSMPSPCPGEHISSYSMEPIHLEAVAQEFPDLKIIIAHLGVQSYLTAVTLIRIFPNIYADLTGTIPGWRVHFDAGDWKKLFRWENSSQKILFGTDVHCSQIGQALELQQQIFDAAGWDFAEQQDIYYNTAKRLLFNR